MEGFVFKFPPSAKAIANTPHSYGTDVYLHLNRLSSSSEPLQ
jgi:hypothetical protein